MKESPSTYSIKLFFVILIGWFLPCDSKSQNLDSLAKIQSDSISIVLQEQKADTIEVVESIDSASMKIIYPLLTDFSVVVDYGKLIGMASGFESKFEIGLELGIKKKFTLNVEYGNGKLTPNNPFDYIDYTSEGSYFRAGLGYKKSISATSNFGLSLRYALASFSDEVTVESPSSTILKRDNLSANWYEAVFFSESEIKTNLYFGFYFSVRYMGSFDSQTSNEIYSIPGYGRTFDKSIPAINLYVRYKLDFTH